jgi:hypothetical protein
LLLISSKRGGANTRREVDGDNATGADADFASRPGINAAGTLAGAAERLGGSSQATCCESV